ncbi:hypothetical protein [Thermaurantiacus sp.]
MRGVTSAPQRALIAAIRQTIAADPWFEGWEERDNRTPVLAILSFDCQPWASLTFAGARHSLALRLHGPMDAVETASDRLEALLVAGDFPLAGHFLADFAIGEKTGEILPDGSMTLSIELEALTIAE